MDYTEKTLRRLNSYNGVLVNVRLDRVELSSGKTTFREVVEHPGGVVVLPVDKNGMTRCVRQYRYPFGEHVLEVPAGKLEKGEEPALAAARELSEETGLEAGRMLPLGCIYTSPGYSTEKLYLYLALDLTQGEAHPDDGELLDAEKLPLAQLYEMALDGEIPDGKSVALILKAKALLDSGRIAL